MHGDGSCGFRAIAHGLFERQEDWHEICEDLFAYLEIFGENSTKSYALAARATFEKLKNSLEWHQHHGARAPVSKWFHD